MLTKPGEVLLWASGTGQVGHSAAALTKDKLFWFTYAGRANHWRQAIDLPSTIDPTQVVALDAVGPTLTLKSGDVWEYADGRWVRVANVIHGEEQ